MIYKLYAPSPLLNEYVKFYHLLHFDLRGRSIPPTKVYFPHAEQCLTFDPRGRVTGLNRDTERQQRRSFSYLSRQQTSVYDLKFDEDYVMLKVVFQPGGLFRLFGTPLRKLGNDYVDADAVIPGVRHVNDQLANAITYEQMVGVVDRFLISRTSKAKPLLPFDKVLKMLDAGNPFQSIDWVASQACLSVRQLERKYDERIGVSPMLYHRIVRFNKAFSIKEKNPSLSWFTIALTCGYSDLSHLIKDFKQLAGSTPSQLAQEEAYSIHRQLNLV
ncbi:helix-turn-helix domain-containing protein [Chryseosolibacter indicus]|uniref:Helix-turn-helix transcriptional regulator n=1 Tax=Chryseosolibacter indicus TaxID=2782351 RepID=A0ABS5VXX1_9BACT|nr:helix-turn-helix transcriptional regulator [Chryseosolibacter indicus]MBT1706106.1 helix-turn-helix transcriptional regulator [Chryseosolibacter indicus]